MAIDLWKVATGGRAHTGSWMNLPDFGLTERTPQVIQNRIGSPLPQQTPPQQDNSWMYSTTRDTGNQVSFNPPPVQKINQTNNGGGGGDGFDMSLYPGWSEAAARADFAATGGPARRIQNQANEALNLINQDYENAMGYLGQQEQGVRGDASTAMSQADLSGSRLKTSLGEEQATRESGVQSQLSTAETGAKSAMQQARDLFRQTQQQNIAQLSALGISSSSVSEALAERLGVETARRIAGVTGSLQEVQQNASKELANIKSHAARRNTEIEEDLKIQKQQINSQMMSAIAQISYSRDQAAVEKARGRQNIWNQAQAQTYELTKQAQQYAQQLKQWELQQSSKLYQSVGDLETSMTRAEGIFTSQPGITQSDLQRGVNINNQGQMSGYVRYAPQKKSVYNDPITGQPLDEYGNPV